MKGVLWNTIGSTMYGANSFIMLTLVGRIGSIQETGVFGVAFSTAQLLYIVGLFGINTFQMTDYAEKYSYDDYAIAKKISCLFMFFGCLIFCVCYRNSPYKILLIILLTLLMMVNAVGELYQSLFFQNNRLDLSGSTLFYRTFWSLCAFCIVLIITKNLIFSIIIQTLINLVITLYYRKIKVSQFIVRKELKTTNVIIHSLIMECFPIFISVLLQNVIINISKYILDIFSNDTIQGYFNLIFIPAQIINLCSQFIFKPLLNQYSNLIELKKIGELQKLIRKQIMMVTVFTCVCALGTYLFGIQILEIIYRKKITMLRDSLTLVIIGGGTFALCQLFYYIFIILRKQTMILTIYIISLLISCGITIALVSKIDLVGAVISFIASHIVILVCYLFFWFQYKRSIIKEIERLQTL